MGSPGRPPHQPTEEGRSTVRQLSALGTRHEDIAAKMGFSVDTLTNYYRKELDDGRIDANSVIAGTLYDQAKNGNMTAAIFWLKTRAGWREVHEVTGANGGPLRILAVSQDEANL